MRINLSDRGSLRLGVVIVAVLDPAIIFLGTNLATSAVFNVGWSIGGLGVVTFLGVLMLENGRHH